MSKKTNTLLVGLVLISLTSVIFAGPPCGGPGGRGSGAGNPGERLANELSLDAEQQNQVQTIMKEQRTEAKAWREQHRKETDAKLSKVLNTEQMEKFQLMKKNRSECRQKQKSF